MKYIKLKLIFPLVFIIFEIIFILLIKSPLEHNSASCGSPICFGTFSGLSFMLVIPGIAIYYLIRGPELITSFGGAEIYKFTAYYGIINIEIIIAVLITALCYFLFGALLDHIIYLRNRKKRS